MRRNTLLPRTATRPLLVSAAVLYGFVELVALQMARMKKRPRRAALQRQG